MPNINSTLAPPTGVSSVNGWKSGRCRDSDVRDVRIVRNARDCRSCSSRQHFDHILSVVCRRGRVIGIRFISTASLGKRSYFVYQGFGGVRCAWSAMVCTEFPPFGREWSHNGVTAFMRPGVGYPPLYSNFDWRPVPLRASLCGRLLYVAEKASVPITPRSHGVVPEVGSPSRSGCC